MRTRLRIWILSELYRPELTSTGYFVSEIAEYLARRRDVTVLCSQPSYSARGQRAPRRENLNGVRVERLWSPLGQRRLLQRAADMLGFSVRAFLRAAGGAGRHDVLIAVTNPPVLPYVAAIVSLLRKTRLVLLIQDVYPEVLASTGFLTRGSMLLRVFDRLSIWLYRRADAIVVLGRDMQELIAGKLPDGGARMRVIENWADLEDIELEPRATKRPIVLQHAGNMGRTHDIAILIEAAAALPESVRLEFIGDGARTSEVAHATSGHGNIVLMPYRPRSERSLSLGNCDVAVISFLPGMAGVSVPSRMYNVMASGRPLIGICDAHSELAHTIRDHQIGWIVPPGDVGALIAVLRDIAANPCVLAERGSRARIAAETRYAKQTILPKYESVIQEIVGA